MRYPYEEGFRKAGIDCDTKCFDPKHGTIPK